MPRQVFIAFTSSPTMGDRYLMKVYSKSSYQKAYNWLTDIAERHGEKVQPGDSWGKVAVWYRKGDQVWFLERHEVE